MPTTAPVLLDPADIGGWGDMDNTQKMNMHALFFRRTELFSYLVERMVITSEPGAQAGCLMGLCQQLWHAGFGAVVFAAIAPPEGGYPHHARLLWPGPPDRVWVETAGCPQDGVNDLWTLNDGRWERLIGSTRRYHLDQSLVDPHFEHNFYQHVINWLNMPGTMVCGLASGDMAKENHFDVSGWIGSLDPAEFKEVMEGFRGETLSPLLKNYMAEHYPGRVINRPDFFVAPMGVAETARRQALILGAHSPVLRIGKPRRL